MKGVKFVVGALIVMSFAFVMLPLACATLVTGWGNPDQASSCVVDIPDTLATTTLADDVPLETLPDRQDVQVETTDNPDEAEPSGDNDITLEAQCEKAESPEFAALQDGGYLPCMGNPQLGGAPIGSTRVSGDELQRAVTAANYLIANDGYTPVQASGFSGNWMWESHMDPTATNPSSGAYGLAQWLGGRKDGLIAFAAANQRGADDFNLQLAYAHHELNGSESGAASIIKQATTLEDATAAVYLKYERPGSEDDTLQNRIDNARQVLAAIASVPPALDTGQITNIVNAAPPIPTDPTHIIDVVGAPAESEAPQQQGLDIVCPGMVAPNDMIEAAVEFALQEVGTQYVWGGEEIGGFDCSGLVWWAFNRAGFPYTRTTAAGEYNWGSPVRADQLQRGDLVFWATNPSDPSTIHHVAIYLGNGEIVDAPHTGDVVKREPITNKDMSEFVGGVRVNVPLSDDSNV